MNAIAKASPGINNAALATGSVRGSSIDNCNVASVPSSLVYPPLGSGRGRRARNQKIQNAAVPAIDLNAQPKVSPRINNAALATGSVRGSCIDNCNVASVPSSLVYPPLGSRRGRGARNQKIQNAALPAIDLNAQPKVSGGFSGLFSADLTYTGGLLLLASCGLAFGAAPIAPQIALIAADTADDIAGPFYN